MKNLVFKWDLLRKISLSKFVSTMYIWVLFVPLVAKLFEFIENKIFKFVIFNEIVPINLSLPFSWKIFYFSALAFGAGNLIIILRCPKIIKDHLNYQSYLDDGKTLKQLGQYSIDIGHNWNELAQEVDKKITNLNMTEEQLHPNNYKKLSSEDPVHYFWPIFEEANEKYNISRILNSLLYFVGFSLFGFVVVQNIVVVVQFVAK